MPNTYTLDEMKAKNQENGGSWFDRETMRFFGSKVETKADKNGHFVTSEQRPGTDEARRFTVRQFNLETGEVTTVGEFQGYASKLDARRAILGMTLTNETRR